MSLPIDVDAVARLACLTLPPETHDRYVRELQNILKLVEQMDTVDVSGVEPMVHPLDVPQPMRTDQVTENPQEDGQMNQCLRLGPQVEMNLFFVPQVIE
jgi:aspartyl-tRNA(Asn)/glutamyl-tRNA(Gln) amidotransferase subunit C